MMKEMNNKEYKFSVVIPVYNVESYIEETILSVINQNIGFEKNIQIILVNDGSTDGSERICLKYAKKYPKNIKYIKQENKGVSSARNQGFKHATGKYINFLDSDDKWNKDVFKKAYAFLEEHFEEIDMVACRMKKFGDKEKDSKHPLDYKFKETRVIDINKEYNQTQLSIASMFVKRSLLEGKEFDELLKYAEDAKLVAQLITNKQKYGILKDAIYNYRTRNDYSSAMQTSTKRKEWYISTIEKSYKWIFEYSKKIYGKVLPYFQHHVMYDLQWRFNSPLNGVLNELEEEQYINGIKELLQEIDDYIIGQQKYISNERKIYILSLKYGKDINKDLEYENGDVFFNKVLIFKVCNIILNIKIFEIKNGILYLEGKIREILKQQNGEIYFEDNNGKKYELEYYSIPQWERRCNKWSTIKNEGFKVEIPLQNIKNIKAIFKHQNGEEIKLKLKLDGHSKINSEYRNSYYVNEGYIIKYEKNIINVKKRTLKTHIKYEIKYMIQLAKNRKFSGLSYRLLYYATKIFYKKPIWIVSDRADFGDDNGLHMFKYLVQNEKNAKIYFAISKKSDDYKKMKKIGKVLKFESMNYKIKFLHCSKVISSQANEYIINVSEKAKPYIKDLYKFDFIFLQHGIIKDDLAEWLHKQNKNIKIFVTSAYKEYESIVNGNYAYDDKIVKLTGLPRYDNLIKDMPVKKQILFMPTWRKNLAGSETTSYGERKYNCEFKESEYYKFYNNLINDERILEKLKNTGYTGKFYIHPNLQKQANDFKGNAYIQVCDVAEDYQKELKENALLITDYSSIAFDFVYLKKPVIYTQFDKDYFYSMSIYDKGYFDYEQDGLGPVCYDYETTVQTIIKYIEADCKLEKIYEDRRSNFYYKFDGKNCERVYKEILKLDK